MMRGIDDWFIKRGWGEEKREGETERGGTEKEEKQERKRGTDVKGVERGKGKIDKEREQ